MQIVRTRILFARHVSLSQSASFRILFTKGVGGNRSASKKRKQMKIKMRKPFSIIKKNTTMTNV